MLPIYYTIADKSRAIKYIHNWKREHISIIKKKQKEPVIYPVFFVLFCLFLLWRVFFIFVYSSQIIKKTKVHLSCKRKMHSVWKIDLKRKLLVFVSLICHLLPFKYATLYLRIICHNILRDTWCQILNTYAHTYAHDLISVIFFAKSTVLSQRLKCHPKYCQINDVAKSNACRGSNNNNRRLLS